MVLRNAFGAMALDTTVDAVRTLLAGVLGAGLPTGGSGEQSVRVRPAPTRIVRTGFSNTVTGGVDPDFGTVVRTGSGQGVNQTGGNLVLTTGTTANAETIIRGTALLSGGVRVRARCTLSQRIANQQFFVELVDVLGDALAAAITSATALTVTWAAGANPFTAANVGQSAYLGGYAGTGTFVPGRYPIASVSGDSTTFTVAGMAAGSGTLSVFGWNYHHLIYSGATATQATWGVGRKGWATTDPVPTTASTAVPGHVAVLAHNDMQAAMLDAAVASNTSVQFTTRGSAVENVPDDATLRLQLRVVNGATAPASTTTWTIGGVAIGNWAPQDVAIQDVRPQANMSALPVQVAGGVVALNAGSQTIGLVGLNGGTAAIGALTGVQGGAASAYSVALGAATLAIAPKTSAGNLFELSVFNPTAAAVHVKLYNKASAPAPATDVPVHVFPVPAGGDRVIEWGANGKRFTTGIAIGVTGGAADTDTTAPATGVKLSATFV